MSRGTCYTARTIHTHQLHTTPNNEKEPNNQLQKDQYIYSNSMSTEEETPEIIERVVKQESVKLEGTPAPAALQYNVPAGVVAHEAIGGAPVRQWLNEYVTPSLLEGVRHLAKDRPEEPLKVLGEWLLKRNEDLKAGGSSSSKS